MVAKYLSIISLFLLYGSEGQTGAGCYFKTCPQAGQVRIDAAYDTTGEIFLGGCNCGCPPEMSDPSSPLYCPEPNKINFNSQTWEGDCSCSCPSAPGGRHCEFPQGWNPSTCSCGCEIGSVGGECTINGQIVTGSRVKPDCTCERNICQGNQVLDAHGVCSCPSIDPTTGYYFASCELPLVKDPISCDCITTTTTLPPVGPVDVLCEIGGNCACPFGTQGTCTITCDIGNDACKDGLIECNNDGYDCNVNCMSGSACAGSAKIIGPKQGKLNVNCGGAQSCEGSAIIDNEFGTDLHVKCNGEQSCKGSISLKFGNGFGTLECNTQPDSCSGMEAYSFNIPATARGFSCLGINCPADVPANFGFNPQLNMPAYPYQNNNQNNNQNHNQNHNHNNIPLPPIPPNPNQAYPQYQQYSQYPQHPQYHVPQYQYYSAP